MAVTTAAKYKVAFFLNELLKGRRLLFWHILTVQMLHSARNICFTNGNVSITATKQTFVMAGIAKRCSYVTWNSLIWETTLLSDTNQGDFCSLKKTLPQSSVNQGTLLNHSADCHEWSGFGVSFYLLDLKYTIKSLIIWHSTYFLKFYITTQLSDF